MAHSILKKLAILYYHDFFRVKKLSFDSNNRHWQEPLIYFVNLNKSATVVRLLSVRDDVLGGFSKFKNAEFDAADKKVYENPEHSFQTQAELAHILRASQQAILYRLRSLGMFQNQLKCLPNKNKRVFCV